MNPPPDDYTTEEAQSIVDSFAAGVVANCPRCGVAMEEVAVGGGTVGTYWEIRCPGCGRTVLPRDFLRRGR
jgi:uncharacterized protein (DUF983 family)